MQLDGYVMANALGLVSGPQAEVETQDDQVGDVSVFNIGGLSHCGHDGVVDTQRDGIFLFNRGIFDIIYFDLPGELLVQSDVSLGARGDSGVGESCQEVGHLNHPTCLIKKLLPKLVHLALVVLGVTELVPIDLDYLDARDGWILESRVY